MSIFSCKGCEVRDEEIRFLRSILSSARSITRDPAVLPVEGPRPKPELQPYDLEPRPYRRSPLIDERITERDDDDAA